MEAMTTAAAAFAVLAVFALFGSLVLSSFGISLGALQIAGGLVVAHSGFAMIIAQPGIRASEEQHAATKDDVSFSPMALPIVAGPGAIGVVIALTAQHPHWTARLGVLTGCAFVAILIGLVLREGTPLVARLGPSGLGALVRVLGFLILAIGVQLALHGVIAVVG